MNANDAYRILGLREGAAADEVKAAYRVLAQKYNPESYDAGPLRDDAAARMDEINAAFDAVMTDLRTGGGAQTSAGNAADSTGTSKYAAIRQMINSGNVENALAQLNAIAGGAEDAEWNFLVGSAYYYKGWVNDELRYFSTATQLDPSNREYAAALQNLQSSQRGSMNGNPYQTATSGYGMQGGCSCCDMCTAMMCMDMCCGCGGRGC
ncbi:MAG: DnaJ domain-containing protein [Ruthenibacterium sp.]